MTYFHTRFSMDFVELFEIGQELFINREQYVSYVTCESEQKDIVCGVQQGFILALLLFILYVNDITYTSDVLEVILFADDTAILYSHPKHFTRT